MIKLQSLNREARWQSSLLCGLSRRLYWEALRGGRRGCKTCSGWFKILLNNCLSAVEHRVAEGRILKANFKKISGGDTPGSPLREVATPSLTHAPQCWDPDHRYGAPTTIYSWRRHCSDRTDLTVGLLHFHDVLIESHSSQVTKIVHPTSMLITLL